MYAPSEAQECFRRLTTLLKRNRLKSFTWGKTPTPWSTLPLEGNSLEQWRPRHWQSWALYLCRIQRCLCSNFCLYVVLQYWRCKAYLTTDPDLGVSLDEHSYTNVHNELLACFHFKIHWSAATAGDAKCLFRQECFRSIKINGTADFFLIITISGCQRRCTFAM